MGDHPEDAVAVLDQTDDHSRPNPVPLPEGGDVPILNAGNAAA